MNKELTFAELSEIRFQLLTTGHHFTTKKAKIDFEKGRRRMLRELKIRENKINKK